MRVITIQHKNVLNCIRLNGEYRSTSFATVPNEFIEAYKFMMKHYNYSSKPIFMCAVGHLANFGGISDISNMYIVEMEIPDRFCKIQDYYCWSDLIYFKNQPNEYEEFRGYKTVDQFGYYVLDMFKDGFSSNKNTVYQVTTQFIRKNWIKKIIPINEKFISKYVDTSGCLLESVC
jgi:hypothetical protein